MNLSARFFVERKTLKEILNSWKIRVLFLCAQYLSANWPNNKYWQLIFLEPDCHRYRKFRNNDVYILILNSYRIVRISIKSALGLRIQFGIKVNINGNIYQCRKSIHPFSYSKVLGTGWSWISYWTHMSIEYASNENGASVENFQFELIRLFKQRFCFRFMRMWMENFVQNWLIFLN